MASRGRRSQWVQNPTDSLFFSGKGSTPLPEYITKEDIHELFSEFEADIKRVVIFRDSKKKSQGKGFITFSSVEVATEALGGYRNCLIDSVPVYLNYYRKGGANKDSQPVRAEPTQVGGWVNKKSQQSDPGTKKNWKRPPKVESYKLLVTSQSGTLPEAVCESDLAEHFKGIIGTPAHLVSSSYDSVTHRFGIVEYRDRRVAVEAKVKVCGTKVCGKYELRVKLESPLNRLEFITVQCSEQELVYLRHYFRDKNTYTFGNCSVDVVKKGGSLVIAAHRDDLKPAEQAIRDSLLQGLVHRHIPFHCDRECTSLIDKKARDHMNEPKITCIVQEQKSSKSSGKITVDVFVFGHDPSCVEETTTSIKVSELALPFQLDCCMHNL